MTEAADATAPVAAAEQARLLADALACEVHLEALGGASRTFRVAGTDDLVTVPLTWPRSVDPVEELARRTTLQERVARRVTVPVPRIARVVPEAGLVVVRGLPGTRLIDAAPPLRRTVQRLVASTTGALLAQLHTWDPKAYEDVAVADDYPPEAWRDEAADLANELGPALTERQRNDVRRFLTDAAPSPAASLRLSHNDLGIEHVLVSPTARTVTGIIDWDDAAICDPAYDFGLLLRDLGPEALDTALATYMAAGATPVQYAERARFYARCTLLEDLAFGYAEGRPEYVQKSLAAWPWTFGVTPTS